MKRAERDMLERAFIADVGGALDGGPRIVQSRKTKAVDWLVNAGLLEPVTATIPGRPPIRVSGYAITLQGHALYCATCTEEDP